MGASSCWSPKWGFQANEELEIRILLDLLNQFNIRESQAGLDDQCTKSHSKWLSWRTKPLAEL